MLNKISFKKIKSPLSLRGAKQRSNLNKGFSLIELMVAVAILAIAIFGIFLAFSTGFQGMADARDRTVATNYAREAMEDIKNMDFDQIITQSRDYIDGTKYEREVSVDATTDNLKIVTSKVYWQDRNGTWKMVETDMVVHFIETTADVATRIILYADPYTVLVLGTTGGGGPDVPADENKSIITAVIKDAKGNTVIDWDKEIIFSLTELTGTGELSSTNLMPPDDFVNGKAIITFTSGTTAGEVTIDVSSESLTPDSVTIKITDPLEPVKINLTAEKYSIAPSTSTLITAKIFDAANTLVESATNEITFSVSAGPGTLSSPTPTVGGIATITLTSNVTPGTITVTASASVDDLETGVVVVLTGGYITLSASPNEVPNHDKSVITVTIKGVNNVPTNYNGNIILETSDSFIGNVDPDDITFGATSSETTEFTAKSEGTVVITASDPNGILIESTLTLTVIEELTPHHIIVYAMPLNIPAGGTETSLITAKVMTEGNVKVTSYGGSVTFTTTAGSFDFSETFFTEGIATAVLYPPSETGTATITVCSPSNSDCTISGETTVGFYIGSDRIVLSADPQNILVGGQNCIVTAKIVDIKGIVISNYNEDIAFSISPFPKTIKFLKATTAFLTQKFKKGIATITLISGDTAGTAVIDAYSGDISGSLNIPVGISSLTLVEDSVDYPGTNTVSFNVNIIGVPITLRQMQVSWQTIGNPPETLYKIEIKTPSTDDPATIFNDIENPALNGENIDFEGIPLSTGTSTIVMYFSDDISGKTTLDVTFNQNSGNYTVNLIE